MQYRGEGAYMPENRTKAATDAGLSEWQKVTALRVGGSETDP